jgi:hypothetical protein
MKRSYNPTSLVGNLPLDENCFGDYCLLLNVLGFPFFLEELEASFLITG